MTAETQPFIGPVERPIAKWVINLYVDCPFCMFAIDLVEQWDKQGEWPQGVEPISHPIKIDATCPNCQSEFECETVY